MGSIYKIYGEDGECLYVGLTTRQNPGYRLVEHCRSQPWAAEIRGMEVLVADLDDDELRAAERTHADLWGPKYGNWSKPTGMFVPLRDRFADENFTPAPRPTFRVCPAAAKLIVLRSGRTLNEAALMGCMSHELAGTINRGRAVEVDLVVANSMAARMGVSLDALTCSAGAA